MKRFPVTVAFETCTVGPLVLRSNAATATGVLRAYYKAFDRFKHVAGPMTVTIPREAFEALGGTLRKGVPTLMTSYGALDVSIKEVADVV
jgi:hypothetical protein